MPTNSDELCDRQQWPRPMPSVTGMIADDVMAGSLGCWDNIRVIAADGHDAYNEPKHGDLTATYRITDASPPPGTLIGRNEWVTLHVVLVDLVTAWPAFHPCDWVTAAEAAEYMGVPSARPDPVDDEAGATGPFCAYGTDPMVTSTLHLPAYFVVDAATAFLMWGTDGQGEDMGGLPGPARCTTAQRDAGPFRTLMVLLSGNRMYRVDASNMSCDVLKRFAQTAIGRIGS